MEITTKSIIGDILRFCPATVKVLDKFNMDCMSCRGVNKESLDKGCRMHGQDPVEVLNAIKLFISEHKK
jgi:hybrid cluster-associated redox disulfide protein